MRVLNLKFLTNLSFLLHVVSNLGEVGKRYLEYFQNTMQSSMVRSISMLLQYCQDTIRNSIEPCTLCKVNYAMSYVKGVALAWFEPYYLEVTTPGVPPPLFMTDYEAFCEELKTTFGPLDPVRDAKSKLRILSMKLDQRIAKYVVNFNRLATQVLWGENALRYQFYTGLPDRIKDQIANVGKPTTLVDLWTMAQNINHHYWEHKSEVSCESKPLTSNPQTKPSTSTSSLSTYRPYTKSGSSSASSPKASSLSYKKPDILHLLTVIYHLLG